MCYSLSFPLHFSPRTPLQLWARTGKLAGMCFLEFVTKKENLWGSWGRVEERLFFKLEVTAIWNKCLVLGSSLHEELFQSWDLWNFTSSLITARRVNLYNFKIRHSIFVRWTVEDRRGEKIGCNNCGWGEIPCQTSVAFEIAAVIVIYCGRGLKIILLPCKDLRWYHSSKSPLWFALPLTKHPSPLLKAKGRCTCTRDRVYVNGKAVWNHNRHAPNGWAPSSFGFVNIKSLLGLKVT
jgi:hypothetical protein